MILREIVTKLGFSIDEKKIQQFENSISQIKASISSLAPVANIAKKAVLGITGTATSMTLLSLHTAKSVEQSEELAKKLGVTSEQMQGLELVSQATGKSIDELNKSMNSVNGKSIRDQRNELLKLAFVIDNKGLDSSKKFLKSWTEFRTIISSVKKELSVQFMPVFISLANKFKDWYLSNRQLISQNISLFVNGLSIALKGLLSVLQAIIAPIQGAIGLFGGFGNAISVVGVALGVTLTPMILRAASAFRLLTISILSNPITWLITALAALGVAIGLLVNDLWHWVAGNDSAVGRVLGSWKEFKESFFGIVDSVTDYFKDSFARLGEWFSGFFDNILSTISSVKESLMGIHERAYNKSFGKNAQNAPTKPNTNRTWPELVDAPADYRDDEVGEAPIDIQRAFSRPIISPSQSLAASGARSDFKINQQITENITVNVPAGTSSEQARSISQQIQEEMQAQFYTNMRFGIDSIPSR